METPTTQASFKFINYLVKESAFSIKSHAISKAMKLNLHMDVDIEAEDRKSVLRMTLKVKDATDNIDIKVVMEGWFEDLESSQDQKEAFMCMNAPAILFPYVRGFVTTITAQAGVPAIIIPTLNLVENGEKLLKRIQDK